MNAPCPIVHLYVLLDRSGSMVTMAEQVVAGFNRLLTEQQADGCGRCGPAKLRPCRPARLGPRVRALAAGVLERPLHPPRRASG